MVLGVRRSQSAYSLNKRHYGKTYKDRMDSKRLRRIFGIVVNALQIPQMPLQRNIIVGYALLIRQRIHTIDGIIDTFNPIFVNKHRNLNSFSNDELYDMWITDRNHVRRMITALFQNPAHNPIERWECPNCTIESLETGFLMFLYWVSFPRKLHSMQNVFGREYSQISRVLKAVWTYLNLVWGHLVTDNLNYFAERFELYNRCFINNRGRFVTLLAFIETKKSVSLLIVKRRKRSSI